MPYEYPLYDQHLRVGPVQAGDRCRRRLGSWLYGWYILNPEII